MKGAVPGITREYFIGRGPNWHFRPYSDVTEVYCPVCGVPMFANYDETPDGGRVGDGTYFCDRCQLDYDRHTDRWRAAMEWDGVATGNGRGKLGDG